MYIQVSKFIKYIESTFIYTPRLQISVYELNSASICIYIVVVVFISNCILLLFTYILDYITLHIYNLWYVH